MEVVEWFKGARRSRVAVVSDYSSCGYGALEEGSEFLIMTTEGAEPLPIGHCNAKPMSRAQCDLRYLRSRAGWWRSPFSSLRILKWLHIRWRPCGQEERAALSPFLLPSAA